jgi:hypothetical protein
MGALFVFDAPHPNRITLVSVVNQDRDAPPRSATHGAVAAVGAIAFLASLALVVVMRPFAHDAVPSAMLVIGITTLAIFAVDLGWQRVYLRPSTGVDFACDDPSWRRTLTKYVGLLASVGLVGVAYWVIPQYRDGSFADYFDALRLVAIPWAILALPYFHFVDRHMREPHDGYWHMGSLVLLRFRDVDRHAIAQHLLGWAIKGFFMALMWIFLCDDLRWLFLFDFGAIGRSFANAHEFFYRAIYLVDVGIGTLGYVMAFRITDTHIRSAEPTVLGWLVALACYPPFWSTVTHRYLPYDTGYPWTTWLAYKPWLYALWGTGILVLSAIYVWATVIFAARFSNLTHRGIITNGPYRFTKHPAYIAKNLTWWMIALPFLPRDDWSDTLPRCAMLLAVNLIYFLRAKTEEWHLARDPEYVRYALWIERHGWLRFFRRAPIVGRLAFGFRTRAAEADVRLNR